MKKIWYLWILVFQLLYSYTDPELEALWDSLSNVCNPTLQDYKLVENYFQHGEFIPLQMEVEGTRRNLGIHLDEFRIRQRRNWKFIGPNEEMPVFEWHKFNLTPETENRCICIYATYNGTYPQKAYRVLNELKENGYSGNVLLRIGGFPNLPNGGLKFSPYMALWKLEFFREALSMGFTQIVIWETSMHPLTDASQIFDCMKETGYFVPGASGCGGVFLPRGLSPEHFDVFKIYSSDTSHIPWTVPYVVGFNFDSALGSQLFHEWDTAVKDFELFTCCERENYFICAILWRNYCVPSGNYCTQTFEAASPPDRQTVVDHSLLFFHDVHRDYLYE